jgi:hypothetical protein
VKPGASASGRSVAAAIALRQNISSLPSRLGQPVIVSGLVVESDSGSATLDDGTGRVRVAGQSAAEAISLLEPGDAIEVGGVVQRDSQGWLIEADPASIVALSAAGDASSPVAPATASRPADRAATLKPGPLASSSTGTAALLLVLALAVAAALAGAYSVRRRRLLAALPGGLGGLVPARERAPDEPKDAV